MAQLGTTPTLWDNNVYAMSGEVYGTMAVTVQFPEDPFCLMPLVKVLTADLIEERFSSDADMEMVDLTQENRPEAEEV